MMPVDIYIRIRGGCKFLDANKIVNNRNETPNEIKAIRICRGGIVCGKLSKDKNNGRKK